MKKRQDIALALEKLAMAEEQFLTSQFLAPVIPGGTVQVRIAGVRCQLRIRPADFSGWGLFRPTSHTSAELVRRAQLAERRRYLDLFPAHPALLCQHGNGTWLALPATKDQRFQIDGLLPVHLAEEADLLDTVILRFDGHCFWFDQLDARCDPGAAAYLRQCLGRMLAPEHLARPGLTAQQVAAYASIYAQRLERQQHDLQQRAEYRLRAALAHAGAQLRDFAERQDVYRVTYDVDGRRHVSVVRKDTLAVQSAGICLSGQDQDFDLHSLVGVLREGRDHGRLVNTGFYEED